MIWQRPTNRDAAGAAPGEIAPGEIAPGEQAPDASGRCEPLTFERAWDPESAPKAREHLVAPPDAAGSPDTAGGTDAADGTDVFGRLDEDTLWRTHATALHRFATLLVGPHDAPDVVSVAFRKVMTQIERGNVPGHPRAYLMRTVRNAAVDAQRSAKRRRTRDLRAAVEHATGADHMPAPDLDLRRAITGLSEQQRSVVYFTYWEDLNSNQVGELLDIAPATVRRHLERARTQLRKTLS